MVLRRLNRRGALVDPLRGAESKGARPRLFWKIDYYDLDMERLSRTGKPSKGSKLFASYGRRRRRP